MEFSSSAYSGYGGGGGDSSSASAQLEAYLAAEDDLQRRGGGPAEPAPPDLSALDYRALSKALHGGRAGSSRKGARAPGHRQQHRHGGGGERSLGAEEQFSVRGRRRPACKDAAELFGSDGEAVSSHDFLRDLDGKVGRSSLSPRPAAGGDNYLRFKPDVFSKTKDRHEAAAAEDEARWRRGWVDEPSAAEASFATSLEDGFELPHGEPVSPQGGTGWRAAAGRGAQPPPGPAAGAGGWQSRAAVRAARIEAIIAEGRDAEDEEDRLHGDALNAKGGGGGYMPISSIAAKYLGECDGQGRGAAGGWVWEEPGLAGGGGPKMTKRRAKGASRGRRGIADNSNGQRNGYTEVGVKWDIKNVRYTHGSAAHLPAAWEPPPPPVDTRARRAAVGAVAGADHEPPSGEKPRRAAGSRHPPAARQQQQQQHRHRQQQHEEGLHTEPSYMMVRRH